MSMSMSLGICLVQKIQLQLVVSMPEIQWSLVQAYQRGQAGPPPYVEPTFEEEEFTPRLKLKRSRIPDFVILDHVARMRLVDEANKVFRFAYTRGTNEANGKDYGYFKIPLLRNFNADTNEIKIRISAAEYERAMAILAAVGEMERISRAVPYHGLYKAVTKHLKRMGACLDDTVLVSVDRGGRIPCTILQRALGLTSMYSLKVNQGSRGDGLDEARLEEFAVNTTLQDQHVLFVDSTVDSGRQINALRRFFDDVGWKNRLGHQSWSIVGSNEYGRNLAPNHKDINWGVNPDSTFEDKPELMGIDYAPGSLTKVIECPSETSKAIRAALLSVPEGYIYSAADIDEQIERQRKQWIKRQRQRRTEHRRNVRQERAAHRRETDEWRTEQKRIAAGDLLERRLARITASKRWQALLAKHAVLPEETLSIPASSTATVTPHGNVLIIGNGSQTLPDTLAEFVADALVPYCSLIAGTPGGNPGAVLNAALRSQKSQTPEVRLYQPERSRRTNDERFGGVPVVYVGPEKEDVRIRMVSDANVVLVLGGGSGTLREALLALEMRKPILLIEGYGPVAEYLLNNRIMRRKPHLTICKDLSSAVQKVIDRLAT